MPTSGLRSCHRFVVSGLVAVLFLTAAGCGKKVYQAGGTVKFKDGQDITPLVGGMVEFESQEGKPGKRPNARGVIQPDGTFRLATRGLGEGAVLGRHRAFVFNKVDEADPKSFQIIDKRFQSYENSGLEFEVTTDKDKNQFTIEVDVPRQNRPQ